MQANQAHRTIDFKFYKRITDDSTFAEFFVGGLYDEYVRGRKETGDTE